MSDSRDPDLLRTLSETDGASPPPAGAPITAERLHARLRLRRLRALAVSATLLLGGLSTWTLWSQPTRSSDPDRQPTVASDLGAELDELSSRIDRLLGELAAPLPPACTDEKELRFELAQARATGLLAFAASTQTNKKSKEIR